MSKTETATQSNKKRGWIFDEILKVGQLEAAMEHNDEEICNLYNDMHNNAGEIKEIERITDELSKNHAIITLDYENRVNCLNDIFDAIEGSNRHYYCQVKHRATVFVKAAENYHARKCDPRAEQSLIKAGKSLALTCSLAFGFEPMDCLRCLSDSLSTKIGEFDGELQLSVLSEDNAPKSEK